MQGNNIAVAQDVYVAGDWVTNVSKVAGDGYVTGNISASNASSLAGTLHVPTGATISEPFTAGTIVREPVTVGPACNCDPSDAVPVQAIGAAHATANDDASIGLDPAVVAGPTSATRLDLPCGNYYLSAITTVGPVAIVAHGNVGLFIGGDVTTNNIQFSLDPTSEFDVSIGGALCNSGGLKVGSPNYPAQMRLYVGGTGACGTASDGIRFSGPNTSFAGNLYATAGFEASSASINYGSLIVGSYSNSASATIHYDRAVLNQGALTCTNAGTPPSCTSCRDCNNQACVMGQCGACSSDADCCAPLVCNQGSCQPVACTPSGQACTSTGACCSGPICGTRSRGICSGPEAGCTCTFLLPG